MAITTGKVRASFVHIFQPRQQDDGDPKYSITLLIPKTDVNTLNAIYGEIEKAKQEGTQKVFGGSIPPGCRIPIYDGDGVRPTSGEPFGEECKGHMVITASAKLQPSIVGLDMQPVINPSEIYSGCYIRVNINFFAYNQRGNKGVGCGLNAVQKIEDGEPLTTRVSAEEAFGGSNAYAATGYQVSAQGVPFYGQAPMQTTPASAAGYTYQQGPIDPITGRPLLNGGIMGIG